jgi:hypothetical protein
MFGLAIIDGPAGAVVDLSRLDLFSADLSLLLSSPETRISEKRETERRRENEVGETTTAGVMEEEQGNLSGSF